MRKNVTICDVAERCGVSFQTVSRIFNGKAHLHRPETVKKVEAVAAELGYVKNDLAKGIRGGKSYSVGIIIDPFVESFTENIFLGAHCELLRNNYLPILLMHNRWNSDADLVRRLSERRVDGLILRPDTGVMRGVAKAARRYSLPVVCVDEPLEDGHCFDFVGTDNSSGIRQGIEHLLALGHKRIAGLFPDSRTLNARRYAFEEMFSHCPELADPVICREWDFENEAVNREMIDVLLSSENRPTAIVAGGDFMLPAIYRVVHERGLRIPEDLSVIGFGNNRSSQVLIPPATTLNQDAREMGVKAVQLLIQRIEDENISSTARELEFDPQLVIRDSTAVPCV